MNTCDSGAPNHVDFLHDTPGHVSIPAEEARSLHGLSDGDEVGR